MVHLLEDSTVLISGFLPTAHFVRHANMHSKDSS